MNTNKRNKDEQSPPPNERLDLDTDTGSVGEFHGHKWSRIHKAMLEILADGLPHGREELHTCLNDDLSPYSNVWAHLTMIRKVLRPHGQDIICENVGGRGALYYRHVRLLRSPYKE